MSDQRFGRHQLDDLTDDQRTMYAEHLRERIYATITLLAVVVVLWQHPDEHSGWGAIGIIMGTVGALWLATLIASRMSYRIAHDREALEPRYHEARQAASGLLAPAGAPVFFVLLSIAGLLDLSTALLIGVISLVLSLFIFSLVSGRKVSDSLTKLLLYSALQMVLGIAVVLLKIAIE